MTRNAQASTSVLRIGFLQELDYLNPFRGLNDPSFELFGMIYDYLYSIDQDGNLVPNLAVAAAPDASGANWTYQIRQGVTWSDGSPFTAEDVNFTINYNIANSSLLFNYQPYVNHILLCPSATGGGCGARVTSPWNVTIYFDGPFVAGKAIFVPIVQKAQWSLVSLDDAQARYDNLNPIGTGPYIADPNIGNQWRNKQAIAVHKNPNYHPVGSHVGPPTVDTIEMIQFLDENQMVGALQSGAIDLGKFTSSGYDALAGAANIARQQGLICTQYWNEIGISQYDNASLNPARYDENVRRAMAKATNKDYILKTIYDSRGVRGADLVTPITPEWSFDPTKVSGVNLTYDIAAANALLDAAGYSSWWTDTTGTRYRQANHSISFTDTNGIARTIPAGTRLIFTMDVRQEFLQERATAVYLTADWARIGIRLDVSVKLESATNLDVYGGSVDTYIWFWSGDPDPNYLLSIQSNYTLNGWNDNYWDNATYNQLYVAQLADYNFTQRQKDVLAAQELHYNSSVYIIYIYPFGEWGWRSDRFTGWGDWNAHPYRQMDNFWGANPLFFDLMPSTTQNPGLSPLVIGAVVGLGVVIAIVAVAAVVIMRRRKRRDEEVKTDLPKP